jgi:hypothetical protein
MKKFFLILLALLVVGGTVGYFLLNEKLPVGTEMQKADELARDMLAAINDSAWQVTGAVEWNFMGQHEHLWDKDRHLARVRWKENEVFVDLSKVVGIAYKKGEQVTGKKGEKLVQKAWKHWVNDSFWLNPVSKAFDEGTTRSLVTLKDGSQGLMISYSSGGSTPGDSYVWLLDENDRPDAWKMWVSIIPIGGLEVPWDTWTTTTTGVEICTRHNSVMDLKLEGVKTAFALSELTGPEDPFAILF